LTINITIFSREKAFLLLLLQSTLFLLFSVNLAWSSENEGRPGYLNVTSSQFGAKGDGITDDWQAIMKAIDVGCKAYDLNGTTAPNRIPVFIPPGQYAISRPIRIGCPGLQLFGAGPTASRLLPRYDGPAIIAEAYGSNNAKLLADDPPWQADHPYREGDEVKDSNGNIEVVTSHGRSGDRQPGWAVGQAASTRDGSIAWILETIGTHLVSGAGSAFTSSSRSQIILNDAITMNIDGLPQVTLEGFFLLAPYEARNVTFWSSWPSSPETHGTPRAFELAVCGACSPPGGLLGSLRVNGAIYVLRSSQSVSPNTVHHIALSYDGSYIRLLLDGTLVAVQAARGTVTTSPFETWSIPVTANSWPDLNNGSQSQETVLYDSLRISKSARYTCDGSTSIRRSCFAKPTAKLPTDVDSLLLLNFPTDVPDGTVGAVEGTAANKPAYLAVRGSGAVNHIAEVRVHDLELCGSHADGVFATWTPNSRWDDLYCTAGATYGFNLYNNDWEDRMSNDYVFGATEGYEFGGSDNDVSVINARADGDRVGFNVAGGEASFWFPIFVDRGNVIYPFIFDTQATVIRPYIDDETPNGDFRGAVYSENPWSPVTIIGGELDVPRSSVPENVIVVNGGQPVIVEGSSVWGNNPRIVHVISKPVSPVIFRDLSLPPVYILSDEAGQALLRQGEAAPTATFGALPTTPMNNGLRMYCSDCDAPTNPPGVCTSDRSRSGSFADAINQKWICIY
jgi:hypothetical protein